MKPPVVSITTLVWTACVLIASQPLDLSAQVLRLTTENTLGGELTATVGNEFEVLIRADLADVNVHALAAYLTISGVAVEILDGQAQGPGPFQAGELASTGVLITNELVSESAPVGATFAGRQLDLAIIRGFGDTPMVGAGAIARFHVRCQEVGIARIAFDENPIRETRYVDAGGVESHFIDLTGLTIHVESPLTTLSPQPWGIVKQTTR